MFEEQQAEYTQACLEAEFKGQGQSVHSLGEGEIPFPNPEPDP